MPKSTVEVRQPFAYDSDAVSHETAIHEFSESMTVQADAEDADINVLVKRFHLTGSVTPLDKIPLQGDFSGLSDYQTALAKLQEADDLFMTMPAELRARFENDPGQFVEFCSHEGNRAELQNMGLLRPQEAAETPILVRMDPTPQPAVKPPENTTG